MTPEKMRFENLRSMRKRTIYEIFGLKYQPKKIKAKSYE
jgi:hypothetical protein